MLFFTNIRYEKFSLNINITIFKNFIHYVINETEKYFLMFYIKKKFHLCLQDNLEQ